MSILQNPEADPKDLKLGLDEPGAEKAAAVIKNQAISEGMKTLRMCGIDKAMEGITTLEEVWRVTAEDH